MADARFHPEAEAEYRIAWAWYHARSPRAADRFEAEVEHVLGLITARPATFPLYDDEHRFATLRRFPYSMIYLAIPDGVHIIALAHSRRRPGYWQGLPPDGAHGDPALVRMCRSSLLLQMPGIGGRSDGPDRPPISPPFTDAKLARAATPVEPGRGRSRVSRDGRGPEPGELGNAPASAGVERGVRRRAGPLG